VQVAGRIGEALGGTTTREGWTTGVSLSYTTSGRRLGGSCQIVELTAAGTMGLDAIMEQEVASPQPHAVLTNE
jgi:hypothetical protein